jgi:hypothetical protein
VPLRGRSLHAHKARCDGSECFGLAWNSNPVL